MEPHLFKYVDFLRIRTDGPKTLRTHIKETIFGELYRNGFSDVDIAKCLKVMPEDVVNYRRGLLVLTENEIEAIAWLKPEMFILNKIVPIRKLSRKDIEDVRSFYHSGDRDSHPGRTTVQDLRRMCDQLPYEEEVEQSPWNYDPSQSFQQDSDYTRDSPESEEQSQTEINAAEESFMPGGIVCYILAYLDKHPELDF